MSTLDEHDYQAFLAWKAMQNAPINIEASAASRGDASATAAPVAPPMAGCVHCTLALVEGGRMCIAGHGQPMAPPIMTRANSAPEVIRPAVATPYTTDRVPRRAQASAQQPAEPSPTPHVVVELPAAQGPRFSATPFEEFMSPEKIAAMDTGPMKTTLETIELLKKSSEARALLAQFGKLLTGQ